MTPGTIIFDTRFEFSDGSIGRKLMVILNDGSAGKYIVALTTSQAFRRSRRAGCQSNQYYPGYYLPDRSCCLNSESWVALGDFHEFDLNHFLGGISSGRMDHIGILPPDILRDLLDCAINCDDITIEQEQILIDIRNGL